MNKDTPGIPPLASLQPLSEEDIPCPPQELLRLLGTLGHACALFGLSPEGQGSAACALEWADPSFRILVIPPGTTGEGLTLGGLFPTLDPLWFRALDQSVATGAPCPPVSWTQGTENMGLRAHWCVDKRLLIVLSDEGETGYLRRRVQELKLELARRREEFDHFAHTVSHDLKGPLHTIKGFAELIEQDLAAGETSGLQADLKRIFDAASRLQAQLEGILRVSRASRSVSPPTGVSVARLAEEALREHPVTPAGVPVRYLLPPPEVSLVADPAQLRTLFSLLIQNAVKFMGPQPSPLVEIRCFEEANRMCCAIKDNGIGIESAFLGQLFSLFRKLDPKTEGLGVGLAVAKVIVETQGGSIRAESPGPGLGATFFFSLPKEGPSHAGDS